MTPPSADTRPEDTGPDALDRGGGTALRAAVLTSTRAPGLERLLERSGTVTAPYRVVGVVASDPDSGALSAAEEAGLPTAVRDPRAFCDRRGVPVEDERARRAFDRDLASLLRELGAEAVVMCGYLWIATRALLDAFPRRVFNIHDADLRIRDEADVPVYRGLRSSLDAVRAGEEETRTTVHVATERVDVGPPLLVSRPFPVHPMVTQAREWGAEDLLEAYAYAQREWMMRACWGPLLDRTLELLAGGRLEIEGGRVLVDGEPAPREYRDRREPARLAAGQL